MPFKSQAQQRWMFAQKPEMARRWASETPDIRKLPQHVGKKVQHHKAAMVKALGSGK